MDRKEALSLEDQRFIGKISNLWSLAKHWEIRASTSKNAEIAELYISCAKQLRQRTQWIDEAMQQDAISRLRTEIAAILESFMNSGWIERFTMTDNTVKIWHSEIGANHANNLLKALPNGNSQAHPSRTEALLRLVCRWIAQQHSGTSPTFHQVENPNKQTELNDQ